jgi:predicted ATP-grasp superfamily ATP-dependent carboligase
MNRVLLVNANNNVALTVTRALGRVGVPVVGVGWNDGGVGMASRYLVGRYWLEDYHALTANVLLQTLGESQARYVMAMGEDVLTHLNTLRGLMPPSIKFLFPEAPVLARAIDKGQTIRYARAVGIDCPTTFEVLTAADIDRVAAAASYPAVLKFSRSTGVGLPAPLRFGYRYVRSADELRRCLAVYAEYRVFPLVQEYVPGRGLGVELCMSAGQVACAFQHERIHELPISGGPAVYRRSVPLDPALLEQAVALLRAMEWEGVAMVEFRRDSGHKRTVLMEVNGRFWGSLPLAVAAGANFPHVLYRTMGEGERVTPTPYQIGVTTKQSVPHLRWFWDAFVRRHRLPPEGFMPRGLVLWEFLLSWDPRVRFDIEQWDDLRPAREYWRQTLGKGLGAMRHVVGYPPCRWRRRPAAIGVRNVSVAPHIEPPGSGKLTRT